MPRETITKRQGIYATHQDDCPVLPLSADRTKSAAYWSDLCKCKRRSYRGRAWDKANCKMVNAPRMSTIDAAAGARDDLKRVLDAVAIAATPPLLDQLIQRFAPPVLVQQFAQAASPPVVEDTSPTLADARALFVEQASKKHIRNKKGQHFKQSAIDTIRGSIQVWGEPRLGTTTLNAIERYEIQAIVDFMEEQRKSGSRIRAVVNSFRSVYNWAIERNLTTATSADHPARAIRLPPAKGKKRDRVITVAEFERRLALLPLEDAIAYAIAGYTGARVSEIRYALAEHVDLDENVIYLGLDEDNAQKSDAALRAVPIVLPLRGWLVRWFAHRGAARGSKLLLPGLKPGGKNSGMLSFDALQQRCDDIWEPVDEDGEPIPGAKLADRMLPHQLRHNFATWCDAAQIRGVVRSHLMGHTTTAPEGGGAAVTMRYTHVLPGDFEEARAKLDAYVSHRGMQLVKAA